MIDLDNTLVDRDAAFRSAVTAFMDAHGLSGDEVAWVMDVDAGGYTDRRAVEAAMGERYGDAVPVAAIRGLLDRGGADRVALAGPVREALGRARAGGWACAIVSNGRVAQQEAKIRRCGLDRWVQGWVISEAAGCKKPDPGIFRAAAEAVGATLAGAWVIGDSPHADIAGARALGLRSVWVSRGRAWAEDGWRPTRIAEDAAAAIDRAIGASGSGAGATG